MQNFKFKKKLFVLMTLGFLISLSATGTAKVEEKDLGGVAHTKPTENNDALSNPQSSDSVSKDESMVSNQNSDSKDNVFVRGYKATGQGLKKVRSTIGNGFKKVGSAIRGVFVKEEKTTEESAPAEEKQAPETDLDAVGSDV
jgi:hypothetical protein